MPLFAESSSAFVNVPLDGEVICEAEVMFIWGAISNASQYNLELYMVD